MNIIIIDDDRLVSTSLKTIVETEKDITVVAVGCSGREAVSLYMQHHPDIVLMDIRMQDMTGLEAGEVILSRDPDAKVLFLTTFSDDEYIIRAMKAGAKGYLLKQDFESIVPSLKAVEAGQRVFGDDIIAKLPSLLTDDHCDISGYGITQKEFEIMERIAQGLSNREIAEKLYLSEGTVRNSISIILQKLRLRGRTQIAIFYYKNHLGNDN